MSDVLIVCAAGASSTFLVHALRRQAEARGESHTFTPASVETFDLPLTTVDVIFVSAHVAAHFEQAEVAAVAAGAVALQLPSIGHGPDGADVVLDLLDSLAHETKESSNHG